MKFREMSTINKIKLLKTLKAFAATLPDDEIKSFVLSYITTALVGQKLSNRDTMNAITALRQIDAVSVEELRDVVAEIFDDGIAELETEQ